MTDRAGPRWEVESLDFLRDALRRRGIPPSQADRLVKTGTSDQGDLVVQLSSGLYVIENKLRRSKTNQLSLGTLMDEAVAEATHYAAARDLSFEDVTPAVLLKRSRQSTGRAFVILQLKDFVRL